ncbi:hypothetical protein HUG10_21215 (plasmid) [Halorarum halophilum]|uniref:Uncharacterized protein n=1 Tax=Halorarum halophilum TaxID=2743090 RepID=A0A7D5H055_9EURY|nr:hypothetical protein [Halobaculum halophilum]QLG30109.1 hypothetical protein HUG10_21215 [Halobaculum halophilum]
MGQKIPTRAELAKKRRSLVNEFPFSVPVEKERRIEMSVPERQQEKLEQIAADLELEIVNMRPDGKSMQGYRDRFTLEVQ